MITLILDGYNVIYAVPELARQMDRSLQAAREALVRLCQAYRARRGDLGRVYVVFDGRDAVGYGVREQAHGTVTVVFTHKPEEADRRILALIDAQAGPGHCVVVSDDNEVCNNARAFGAGILSVQAFMKKAAARGHLDGGRSAGGQEKTISVRDAAQITEEYRKRLDDA